MTRRRRTTFIIISVFLFGVRFGAAAQEFAGFRISNAFATVMPVWIYNGFTETDDGTPVQGSDVSPIRFSAGVGMELDLFPRNSLQPEVWIYQQEYIELAAYEKVVPTQIETGSAVGDIANTISLAIELPWVYTITVPRFEDWSFAGRGGLALIFRIPIAGVDNSAVGPVTGYWFSGRFVYPYLGVGADYRFTDRMVIGAGLNWYVPIYNVWDGGEQTGFLDETMLRYGLRVRYLFGQSD